MKKILGLTILTIAFTLAAPHILSAAEKKVSASISIYRDQLTPIRPEVFGQNVAGSTGYKDHGGGIWDPLAGSCDAEGVTGCWNSDALQAAKDAGYTLLGFPGGASTRIYDWEKGIGEGKYPFGILEFLVFAQQAGAEPVLGVSMYDTETGEFASANAIAKAKALVEFCNATSGDWAQMRKDLGYEEPFNVKYWTIDYYPWEEVADPLSPSFLLENIAPAMYAAKFVDFAEEMKSVDSSILIGAPSYVIFDLSHFVTLLLTFPEVEVDTNLWPDFFFIVYLRPGFNRLRCDVKYEGTPICDLTPEQLSAFVEETLIATLAAPDVFVEDVYNEAKAELNKLWEGYSKDAYLALTNYHAGLTFSEFCGSPGNYTEEPCPAWKYIHSLGSALFSADLLMQTMQLSSDKMLLAQHWVLADKTDETNPESEAYSPSHFGALKVLLNPDWSDTTIVRRPDQLAFELFGQNFAQQAARTSVDTETFDTTAVRKVPAIVGIGTEEDEAFLRIRLFRQAEPISKDIICGTGDSENPDPDSYISGDFMLDNVFLAPETSPTENLVINGSFENGFSGWTHMDDPTGAETTIECEKSKQNCFVKLSFDDSTDNNPFYSHLYQIVQVQPNKRYFLKYLAKSDSLTVKTRNLMCDAGFDYTSAPGSFNSAWWSLYGWSWGTVDIVSEADCPSQPNCVRVYFNPNTNSNFRHLWQEKPYDPNTDPTRYIAVAKIKTVDMVGRGRIESYARKPDDTMFDYSLPIGFFGTTPWLEVRKTMELTDPENTAKLGVRFRRLDESPPEGPDGSYAYYDDVMLYRDPQQFAPSIAIDFCKDAICSEITRSIYDQPNVAGSTDWQVRKVSGLPYLSALTLAEDENDLRLFVINRSPDTDVEATITMYLLGKDDDDADDDTDDDTDDFSGWIIEEQVLYGTEGLESTNEDYDPQNPDTEAEVRYTEPEEYDRITESQFSYTFDAATMTVLHIYYQSPSDDDDDDTDDDTGDDDDSGGASGICGCGCGCSF